MLRWTIMITMAASLGAFTGCAAVRDPPAAPYGRGWATRAQGYREDGTIISVTNNTYGNTRVTTATVTNTWGVQNGTEYDRTTFVPYYVKPTLQVGRSVADFPFNNALASEVDK